jgi:hypothetical protein
MHRPNAARDAPPLACSRLVQRVRWNGGLIQMTEERQ